MDAIPQIASRETVMSPGEAYSALSDAYIGGDPADILAAEYAYLLTLLAPITEWRARNPYRDGEPTLLERLAAMVPEQLPDGPAPTLRDTLHALDIAFATWQAESAAWQRWQARVLAALSAKLERE
jgi:hypothetical protein